MFGPLNHPLESSLFSLRRVRIGPRILYDGNTSLDLLGRFTQSANVPAGCDVELWLGNQSSQGVHCSAMLVGQTEQQADRLRLLRDWLHNRRVVEGRSSGEMRPLSPDEIARARAMFQADRTLERWAGSLARLFTRVDSSIDGAEAPRRRIPRQVAPRISVLVDLDVD